MKAHHPMWTSLCTLICVFFCHWLRAQQPASATSSASQSVVIWSNATTQLTLAELHNMVFAEDWSPDLDRVNSAVTSADTAVLPYIQRGAGIHAKAIGPWHFLQHLESNERGCVARATSGPPTPRKQ